jgi:hypothetical protein
VVVNVGVEVEVIVGVGVAVALEQPEEITETLISHDAVGVLHEHKSNTSPFGKAGVPYPKYVACSDIGVPSQSVHTNGSPQLLLNVILYVSHSQAEGADVVGVLVGVLVSVGVGVFVETGT